MIFFTVIAVLLFSTPSLADSVPDAPYVEVVGSKTIEAVPDILRMSLGVEDTSRDVSEASQIVKKRSAALIAGLQDMGISEEDISSSQLRITPHYNWSKLGQIHQGTVVSRTVQVALRDLTKYDELVRLVIDSKVGRINSSMLESSKETELRQQALQGAVADARMKASSLVSNIPEKVGSVYSISSLPSRPEFRYIATGRARPKTATAFKPGVIEFSESVTVVFFLEH